MQLRCRSGQWIVVLLTMAGVGAAGRDVPLIDAVKNGDRAAIRALLQLQVDVNAPDVHGTTALHWAARRSDLETAGLLLRARANARAANRYGVTPLALAATNGDAAIIEQLLKAGADANTALPEGETPLMTAALTGRVDAVRVLLVHGANVGATEKWRGQTALMWAASENHAAVVRTLIEMGADIKARSDAGFTPLLFAVRDGAIDAARALLEAGASVKDTLPDTTSALVLAIINAHYELAALLLEKGVDPNVPDLRGSALHALSWMRKPGYAEPVPLPQPTGNVDSLALAEALLKRGANPNVRIAWKESKRAGFAAGLIDIPKDIRVGRGHITYNGATPFYLAARHSDVPYMRLLVAYGADALIPTVQNVTPLMAAAGIGFCQGETPGPNNGTPEEETLEAVKLAVTLGNDVNAVADFGDYPVEGDGVTLLRRLPLNLNEFPEGALGDMRWNRSTAMHGAALRGANSIVRFLLEMGAKLDVKNKIEWTPLMVADGVFVCQTEKEQPQTAAYIRQLLGEAARQRD